MIKNKYYYNSLTTRERAACDELRIAIESLQTEVQFNKILSSEEINHVLYAINYDWPEYYYFYWVEKIELYSDKMSFILKYQYPIKDIPRRNKMIQAKIQESLQKAKEANIQGDFVKSVWIHNHISKLTTYDYGSYEERTSERRQKEAHTIAGVFCRNTAVCEGIAKAYKLLCDYLGVECILVVGMAGNEPSKVLENQDHAWNMIKINGKYGHVDVTWDMRSSRISNQYCYDYFGVSDKVFSVNHSWKEYPVCVEHGGLTYFEQTGKLFKNPTELKQYVKNELSKHPSKLYFQLDNTASITDKLIEKIKEYIKKQIFQDSVGSKNYQLYMNRELYIFLYIIHY